ncbi:MAG: hypothetical protein HY711_01910 [Candidatus Melainabacteria bacterium]|nr:hypothetical protein [Candidatus Melainabacteria bacterium]
MLSAPSVEITEVDGFTAEDLYELQRRRGKLKPPNISYVQLNSLKKKCHSSEGLTITAMRSVHYSLKNTWTSLGYMLFAQKNNTSWLEYVLWGHRFKETDIMSGRSRLSRLKSNRDSVSC